MEGAGRGERGGGPVVGGCLGGRGPLEGGPTGECAPGAEIAGAPGWGVGMGMGGGLAAGWRGTRENGREGWDSPVGLGEWSWAEGSGREARGIGGKLELASSLMSLGQSGVALGGRQRGRGDLDRPTLPPWEVRPQTRNTPGPLYIS